MRDHSTPESACADCGYVMDNASGVSTEEPPSPGDIGLCFNCGHVMIYGENRRLREPTDEEIIEIAGDSHLVWASNAITAYKKRVGEPSQTADKEDG